MSQILTNVVMIARNRPRLTRQALDSLFANTRREQFTLTLVDDASEVPAWDHRADYVLRLPFRCGVMGTLRNCGARVFGPDFLAGEYLYFSDNDAYFTPGWLETLVYTFEQYNEAARITGRVALGVLGGYNHPYHAPVDEFAGVRQFDQLGAFSMFMPWNHWERFGPFDESANPDKPQATQGEDVLFCDKLKAAGYLIGAVHPFVVLNCGLTSTDGKSCTGAHAVAAEPRMDGVIYE